MHPEEAFIYLIKVNIALVVFYLFYRLLFSRDTFFTFRRVSLLSLLLVAFLYPLVLISFEEEQKAVIHQTVTRYAGNLLPELTVGGTAPAGEYRVADLLFYGYGAVVIALLGRIILQVISILRLVRAGRRTVCLSVPVIALPGDLAPFSFFKWIFVNPSRYETGDLQEILTHEQTHASQYHSLDVMISEILCAFFWINPAMWLLKTEIRRNLEFLADKRVVHAGFDRKAYQYHLLRLSHPSANTQITNSFNVTPLKKRIMMMNKQRTSKLGLLKYALLVPVLGMLVLSNNVQAIVNTSEHVSAFMSQDSVVASGVVVDSNNLPLEGASVIVKGSGIGTSTNEKGEFSITVAKGTTLIFSYVGKTNRLITVNNAQKQRVQLITEPYVFDEFVVVGYSPDHENVEKVVFEVVEDMPRFIGEDGNIMKFIANKIRYPMEAQKNKIQGKVFVSFIINQKGEPVNFKVVKSVHPLLDQEALRVLQLMPNWQPGTQRGKPVNVSFTVPINFQLQ